MPARRLLPLLALLPALAAAGEWHVYGRTDDDRAFLYVDVASITTHGPGKRAWFQEVRAEGAVRMALYGFRCARREFAAVSRRELDRDGQLVKAGKAQRLVYQPVPPDSVAADMLAIACAADPRALITTELGGQAIEGEPREHARQVRAAQAAPAPAPAAVRPSHP